MKATEPCPFPVVTESWFLFQYTCLFKSLYELTDWVLKNVQCTLCLEACLDSRLLDFLNTYLWAQEDIKNSLYFSQPLRWRDLKDRLSWIYSFQMVTVWFQELKEKCNSPSIAFFPGLAAPAPWKPKPDVSGCTEMLLTTAIFLSP